MTATAENRLEERVLVLTRRDVAMAQTVLHRAGLEAALCADLPQLCCEFQTGGAAAILLSEEVLLPRQSDEFLALLASQPRWSDIPVVVLLQGGVESPIVAPVLERIDNVVLLPRPLQASALLSAARSALRARRRQYQTREYLAEQKRAEAALRESEQRARLAVDTAALGTYQRDLLTNEITLNTVCREILGAVQEHLPLDIAPKSLHPDDQQLVLPAVARAFDPTLREICAAEFRILRPDGSIRWVSGRGRVVFDESVQPPKPLKFLGVLLDITDRKSAEEQLKRRNLHLQLLHRATADLLLGHPPADLLRGLLPQIAANFNTEVFMLYEARNGDGRLHLEACSGVSEDQQRKLQTLRYGRAICARPADALRPIIATRLQTVQAPKHRFVCKLGFRSYLYYPLILHGRLQGTLAFASRQRDDYDTLDLEFFQSIADTLAEALESNRLQSELKFHATHLEVLVHERTARLQEAIAELEHMSYSMVHDMRAPLRAMQAFATLAQEECAACDRPLIQEYLRRIRNSTDRLDRLVTDSLSYNKVVREDLPTAPVDLGALLRAMLKSYPHLHPSLAEIHLDFTQLFVLGNEALLTQTFGNLLGNAVKFVAPGVRPRIRIWAQSSTLKYPSSAASARADWPSTLISIEDNGIGIPRSAWDKMFRMFERMHREDEYPGTGIGLAIAKKAVERMGGRIGVESEPAKGSRFWVELPTPAT
jgi:PAS domain S-box-containing protein